MKCSQCGSEIRSGQKFCSACGYAVSLVCPHCGASYEEGDAYCATCGKKLNTDVQPDSTQIINNLPIQPVRTAQASTGVRKHLTILFTDIKGSTHLTEDLDPEEARNLLLPAVEEMLAAVYRYNGTVIHTAGDGLSAIFGAPKALENHALHACLAAITMRKNVKKINSAISIRVGLHSGEVVLDTVGNATSHLEYDIVGPAVNLAARMEQTAEPNSIQITKSVLNLVEKNVNVDPETLIQVKGFKDPVPTYKLKTVKNINKLFAKTNREKVMPLIGRAEEMAKLNRIMEQVGQKNGVVVSISGQPGIGKSRFVYEFLQTETAKKCTRIEISGFSHTSNITLFPILRLFVKLMEIEDDDSNEMLITKIDPYIKNISLPYALNATLSLLQRPITDMNWNKLPAELKQKYTFEIGIRILLNEAINTTCILLVEDMHWVDSETEAFLNLLMTKLDNVPILLLITFRPEYQAHWLNKINHMNIILNELQQDQEKILLDNLLGNDISLTDIKLKLLNECKGNPFFIQEIIKDLVSRKILIGEPKNYSVNVTELVGVVTLPESIFSVIQTQISILPEQQKKILEVASIIGQRFTYELLSQLVEMSQKEIRKSLNELMDNNFINEIKTFPELEFSFNHSLFQETLYANLLKTVRKSIHQKIVTIMEKTYSTELPIDKLQVLANHAYFSEVWEKALYFCKMAAEKLYMLNSSNLSAQLYNRSLIALEHLPKDKDNLKVTMDIYFDMHITLNRLGRIEENRLLLNKALEIVTAENDSVLMSVIYSFKTINALFLGETEQALEFALQSNDLAIKVDTYEAKLASHMAMSYSYLFLGEYSKAFKYADELLDSMPDKNYEPFRVPYGYLMYFYLTWSRAYTGNFLPIEAQEEQWSQICNLKEVSFHSYLILGAIGLYYFYKGNLEEAIDYLSRALTHAINLEIIITVPGFASALGWCYLQVNQYEKGQQHITWALNTARMLKFAFISSWSLGIICESLLFMGEYEKAKDLIGESLKIIEARKMKGQLPWLLRIASEIDMELPNPDYPAIKKQLEQALQMAHDLNMPAHVAHCHLALGKLYQRSGDKVGSTNEFNSALLRYQELDMPFWIQKVSSFI